jgi:hypothetical protein
VLLRSPRPELRAVPRRLEMQVEEIRDVRIVIDVDPCR